MKKIVLAAVLFCGVALSAQAQEFTPFRFDAGVGYGLPFMDGLNGGVLFYAEPKYAVIDQISVGLRWEGALFALVGENVSLKMSSAYYATGDYFFNNNSFRPFVGIGLGAYSVGGLSVSASEDGIDTVDGEATTTFGALARVGFDISHFRLTVFYNLATTEQTFHYLGFAAGFYIGGGKK